MPKNGIILKFEFKPIKQKVLINYLLLKGEKVPDVENMQKDCL